MAAPQDARHPRHGLRSATPFDLGLRRRASEALTDATSSSEIEFHRPLRRPCSTGSVSAKRTLSKALMPPCACAQGKPCRSGALEVRGLMRRDQPPASRIFLRDAGGARHLASYRRGRKGEP